METNFPFRKEDLLAIESILYETPKEECAARQFLNVNTNFPTTAGYIAYQWYDRKGSAAILAHGAAAKDVPGLGGTLHTETQKVYTIATKLEATKKERAAAQQKANSGKGPALAVESIKVETARELVNEKEDELVFIGSETHKHKGFFNFPDTQKFVVAEGAAGANATERKSWDFKTPREKLKDILAAYKKARKGNFFRPDTLVIDADREAMLMEPYSDSNPQTIMEWILSKGSFFKRVVVTSWCSADKNGLGKNCFMLLDTRPKIMELAEVEPLKLGQAHYDLLDNSEQAVSTESGGLVLRHPQGVVIATDI